MEPKGALTMPSENAVQLSSAQKRDLLGMSAAAVITTALIAAPIFLQHDTAPPTLVDPTVITAEAVPAPVLIQAISPATFDRHFVRSAPASVSTSASAPVRRRARADVAPVRASLSSRPIAMAAPVLVAANMTSVRPSKPLGKRIAGLFTGDGTYSVRPFPTISTERQ
jgi:hypothetical protein